jgi:pimeloyl-ACP methyl ester carboxylesterase
MRRMRYFDTGHSGWKSKIVLNPQYLVATDDKMIPPDAQLAMSKRAGSKRVEVKGSHAVYVSQPEAVADLITQAAQGGQEK